MDEEISAINTITRSEKIKNFFLNNKKKIIIVLSILILLVLGYFAYAEMKKRNKIGQAAKNFLKNLNLLVFIYQIIL